MVKQIQVWCQTDIGLKRMNNEDSFLIDPDLGLYVVADGMGGHQGGEVASQLAVQVVREVMVESYEKDSGVKPSDLLQRAYSRASNKIFEMSLAHPELKGMGTTLVVALVRDDTIYFANVGDSRAYLARPEGFWQLSEDHSLMNEQMKAGIISEENIGQGKNVITRSVGFEKNAICDVVERKLDSTDTFLMCSDGLTGMVTDPEIYNLIKKNESEHVVGNLVEKAKDNGGLDNVTVMFMKVFSS